MHITRMVREMNPPRYTMHEAAKLAGVSVSTLKRWKSGAFVPTESRTFGKIVVDLYTPEDIPVLIAIKKTNRPGRKKATHVPDPASEASEAPDSEGT